MLVRDGEGGYLTAERTHIHTPSAIREHQLSHTYTMSIVLPRQQEHKDIVGGEVSKIQADGV